MFMTEQNNQVATSGNAKSDRALADLRDAGEMVQKYAHNLLGKERAQQFATHIAIMAQKEPKIRNAKPESVVAAMMACVHLNLMPNTPEGLAYIIPYGNEIQFQVGYKGLLKLAQRSGQIKSLNAELIFEGDEWDVDLGTERKLTHKPNFDVDRTDYSKVTHAYMSAVLINGEKVFEIMTRKELDKIKDSSKAKSTDTPWHKWPAEMAKKSVVKRGTKLLPSSDEDTRLQYAAVFDSWGEAGKLNFRDGEIIEGEAVAAEDAAEARRKRIQAAEAKRKELTNGNHKPSAVTSQGQQNGQTSGGDSGEEPTPPVDH
jgi:recombination protein RecT